MYTQANAQGIAGLPTIPPATPTDDKVWQIAENMRKYNNLEKAVYKEKDNIIAIQHGKIGGYDDKALSEFEDRVVTLAIERDKLGDRIIAQTARAYGIAPQAYSGVNLIGQFRGVGTHWHPKAADYTLTRDVIKENGWLDHEVINMKKYRDCDSITWADGTINVYPGAFTSPGMLAVNLYIETLHYSQLIDAFKRNYSPIIRELDVDDMLLLDLDKFGLTDHEKKQIEWNRMEVRRTLVNNPNDLIPGQPGSMFGQPEFVKTSGEQDYLTSVKEIENLTTLSRNVSEKLRDTLPESIVKKQFQKEAAERQGLNIMPVEEWMRMNAETADRNGGSRSVSTSGHSESNHNEHNTACKDSPSDNKADSITHAGKDDLPPCHLDNGSRLKHTPGQADKDLKDAAGKH
jgi:hypothetical protein